MARLRVTGGYRAVRGVPSVGRELPAHEGAVLSPCSAVHRSIGVGKPVEAYWIKPYRKAPVCDLTGLRYDASSGNPAWPSDAAASPG